MWYSAGAVKHSFCVHLGPSQTVIMTGMDWILCISTPVRSGHQRALTKAFCSKRGERQRYWLGWTLVNLFLSPFFSIFFFICLSFHYYSLSLWLSDLPLSASTYALSIPPRLPHPPPLPLQSFIYCWSLYSVFVQFRDSPRCVRWCFTLTNPRCRYYHSFTPVPNTFSSSSSTQRYLGAGEVTLVQSKAVLIPLDN